MKRRGVGLGVTLVIVALLAVVGFTLAALTVGRIQLLGNLQHKRQARQLAMSAIQATLGKLSAQPQYGLGQADPVIQVGTTQANQFGRLCFNRDQASQLGLPLSVNNLQGLTAVSGPYNVPAASARLVAEGRYGGSRELLEALITQPVFPFALASTGPIHSSQGLIVATLAEDSENGRQNLLSDPVRFGKPANLLSNSSTVDSVQILGPSTVCGDLQSSGRVDLNGNPIRILGELRENRDPEPLPEISLNALLPSQPQVLSGAPSNAPTLSGAVLCNGSFSCTGNLKLQGASLYVRGNLSVGGELQGSGSVTVEGTTQLHGAADLSTLGKVAIVSQGDLSLQGSGPSRSFFKGIVYTRGKLTAHGLLVYGCLLGAGPGPASGPQLDLQDCVVVQETGPIIDQSSSPAQGTSSLRYADSRRTNVGEYPVSVSARLLSSQQLRISMRRAEVGQIQNPMVDYDVQFNSPAEVAAWVSRIQNDHDDAISIALQLNTTTGPTTNPGNTNQPAISLGLDLTDPAALQSQLRELANQLARVGESTTLFDLNQFLRANERLRLASCHPIH